MKKNKALLGRLALFSTSLIWGTSFVVLKNALETVGIFWILAIRFSIAALIFGLAAGKRLFQMSRTAFKGGILLGICLALAYIVQTFGLKYTTPGKNAFLTSAYCVLVPFLAWLIYQKKPDVYHIVAAILCVLGVGLVSLNESLESINIGDILTLLCGVFYALQIIVLDRYLDDGEPLCLSVIQFAVAALICWAGALPFEPVPHGISAGAWFSIAYMSVICTGLCFFLEAWGIRYTPANTAAVLMTLEAVFGVLFSVLFFHEAVTPRLLAGFAVIFFSVILSETKLKFGKRS